jgi:DNA (cytosine-5)-methyltransferase 1
VRLLDLFCGAGGAAMGYYRAGFKKITGIDNRPQPRYPFKFIQADALEYLEEHGKEYDVIHASPPCQAYSIMQNIHKNKHKHPDYIKELRILLEKTKKLFVIENVPGAPLKNPILLCGSMFGLKIIRHRLFECHPSIDELRPPCNHIEMYDPYHGGEKARREKEKLALAMGITHFMTRPEVREAIPPAYTEWIGRRIMEVQGDRTEML